MLQRLLVLTLLATAANMPVTRADETPLWHTRTIEFTGPQTSEAADPNPFTDYRLHVTFKHKDVSYQIRGFYAADGNSAETSADRGSVWKVRFTPDRIGQWQYSATLRRGSWISIDQDPSAGELVKIDHSSGEFQVVRADPSEANLRDFGHRGKIVSDGHYLRFGANGPRMVKGGANSPENLLAFVDFDATFRRQAEARKGEAAPPAVLHSYAAHVSDWKSGDPIWKGGKGKGLIGAMNYLASQGMNSVYFLMLNINGDGNDVWPYASPDDFTRFDCSKLDQWEIVFAHMQRLGILLHVVTQETENERMLDDGDVGNLRKLYYRELISRFAHHPGLIWNLGEENGPADFSPNGQTSEQQRAMASYLRGSDPYDHPILIHTHSTPPSKDELLVELLGHTPLDGLSFQVDQRQQVYDEIVKWRAKAAASSRPWMITMDEIGKWHTGALTDAEDPNHDSLRRHALWGSLLAGGAGVEWYFGAQHPHNDLTSEDLRQRANLWKQTRLAMEFFENHLPYWEMTPSRALSDHPRHRCFAMPGKAYVMYVESSSAEMPRVDLGPTTGNYVVEWFDPKEGGALQSGSRAQISGPGWQDVGQPPGQQTNRDWVVLLRRAR